MERLGIFTLISIIAFSMSVTPAIAQSQTDAVGDGIHPDSFLYPFDVFIDNVFLAFTAGDVEKAKLSLKIAEERLQEAKLMIEQNKLSEAQTAQIEHDKVLSVTETSIDEITRINATEEIKQEIEIERELKDHKKRVKTVSGELKVKIRIRGEITADQQALIDSILEAMEGKTGEVEIKTDNKKQETKIKIKQQTGKSDEEIDDEVEELEIEANVAGLEVEAEIVGDQSEIKIGREFSTTTVDRDAIIDEIIREFVLDRETADTALEIEVETEEKELEEKFKVEVEVEDGIAEVEVKLKFILNSVDREDILDAVVERSQLTREQVGNALEFEAEEEELEIEVEIENGEAEIEVKIGGEELEFTLETANREAIISEIIERTGLTREQIESVIEFEIEEMEEETEEEESEEDLEEDSEEEQEEE